MKLIAIYGLGTETEKAIPMLSRCFYIVGLLDGFQKNGEIYGYPIISLDEAVNAGVEQIIVVARPGSCKAIAKKIGSKCREENIELFDIRGKDLLKENPIVYDFKNVNGYTYSELLEAIEKTNVVSFDLFDTLVVRNITSYTDIFEIMYFRMIEEGKIVEAGFLKKRIASEKKLSLNGQAPRLREIYEDFCEDKTQAEELAEMEFSLDMQLIRPRKKMIKAFEEAKCQEKLVYITSDTYYSKEQIKRILEANGIEGYNGLILSCENKTSKSGDLYEVLKKKSDSDAILHIGDDIVADIEKATEHGLKCFHIYSAAELLDLIGALGLDQYAESLSDRIHVGMFMSEIFNSPFQFEDEKRLHIDSSDSIGYLIFAPIIIDFVGWFQKKVQDDRYSDVWFCARDGYLIKKLYELEKYQKESRYFLTSRIAAIRSGVENIDDIKYVDEMKFCGTLSDNLKTRFGLDEYQIPMVDKDGKNSGLGIYTKSILESAKVKKANYVKYIDKLGLGTGDIAFFDFVAKGTSQMYAQKLIKNHICGFYFLQLEPDYMKDKNLEITPFYTKEEQTESAIFDSYYILETILTAPNPSLDEFDNNGNPIYAMETRSEKDINCFLKVQEGIMNYAKKYLLICPKSVQKINKKMDELLLQLLYNVEIRDKDFKELIIEDPFFNRMTYVTDIF